MAEKKSDGVFIFAVLVVATLMLQLTGFGGLGSGMYSSFVFSLLMGVGAVTYFAVKGAGGFGVLERERALLYAGIALAGSLAFSFLLLNSAPAVFSSIAVGIAIACAAPLIGLAVRARSSEESAAISS